MELVLDWAQNTALQQADEPDGVCIGLLVLIVAFEDGIHPLDQDVELVVAGGLRQTAFQAPHSGEWGRKAEWCHLQQAESKR